MKRFVYTSGNRKFLSEIELRIQQPTSKFRADETKNKHDQIFKSRNDVVNYYFSKKLFQSSFLTQGSFFSKFLNHKDFSSRAECLSFVVEVMKKYQLKNIVSLGCGLGVNEYLLKKIIPSQNDILACDFNPFIISKIIELFPELTAAEFDFFKDNVGELLKNQKRNYDLAMFFSASYVLDDSDFIKLFSGLKNNGVKKIIDFQSGFIRSDILIKERIKKLISLLTFKKYASINYEQSRSISLQGYARSKGELHKLYKKCGLSVVLETKISTYDYVVVLE